jgi:type II secretory pathway component PulF
VYFWPAVLTIVVVLPVALKVALRSKKLGRAFDAALMQVPVFGSLVAMFALSRFARNLGMLYQAGIPLLRGLEICRSLVGNRAIAHALDQVRNSVLEGTPLSKSLSQHSVFPATVVTMISTGETSGTLDVALRSVSDYYNKIIPRRIKIVFSIFDPVMMVSLIAIVGTVALAVILPILQLWNTQ